MSESSNEMATSEIKLNKQQSICLSLLLTWWTYRTSPTFEISGAAGTGKTTIINFLIKKIGLRKEEVLFMAYVGKATLAMSRNGLNAKTIHSSICDVYDVPARDKKGNIIYQDGKIVYKPKFVRKPQLDAAVKLIVVDEGGMVPKNLAEWLLKYKIPIIVLGDLNQLPPVMGASFFLKKPDVILTEIMRQAKDSPIPHFARSILDGVYLKPGSLGDKVNIIQKCDVTKDLFREADVVICGMNKTRSEMNELIRSKVYNIHEPYPIEGDKLICRENDWDHKVLDNIYLINGMIGYVVDVDLERFGVNTMNIDFRPEFVDAVYSNLTIDRKYLTMDYETKKSYMSNYNKFEYGYCITCHLAQGSQYNNVVIFVERFGGNKMMKSWLYTAVTRAIDKVTLIV